MNRTNMKSFIASLLIASGALTTHAQTSWVTVYDLPNGVCGEMCKDAAGNVCAAGRQIAADGSSMATIMGSTNQGTSWFPLDSYFESFSTDGKPYAHNRALALDPVSRNLFAGGNLNNLLPDGTYQFNALWFIREGNPDLGVWSTADDNSKLANDIGEASCADIMVTPNGAVYAAGCGPYGWAIRKRGVGETTFRTVVNDRLSQSGTACDLGFHSDYGVFAVGETNGLWTVRRSSNGESNTWTTVDLLYTARQWVGGRALCMLATPSKIHVVGSAYKYHSGNHWIVRSSSDGGQTWTMTDDYGTNSEAIGIAQDAVDNLWVCGWSAGSQWTVRKGTPGTKWVKQGNKLVPVETITWTTVDSYTPPYGTFAQPNGITLDGSGNIFVGGRADETSGLQHWVVRKLPAQ